MTAGITRAVAVALLAEILLVIGQPSPHPVIFAGQVAASALLAGVLAVGLRQLRTAAKRAPTGGATPGDGDPP